MFGISFVPFVSKESFTHPVVLCESKGCSKNERCGNEKMAGMDIVLKRRLPCCEWIR